MGVYRAITRLFGAGKRMDPAPGPATPVKGGMDAPGQRRQALDPAERWRRVLVMSRRITRLAAREQDLWVLCEKACDLLTEVYCGAWIRIERGGPEVLAHAGWNSDELARFSAMWEAGQQPPCTQTDRTVVVEKPEERCEGCPLQAPSRGRCAIISPIRHDGTVLGVLGVSHPAEVHVDANECDLMTEVADDLGYAVADMGLANAQQENLTITRAMFESAPLAMFIVDEDTRIRVANCHAAALAGIEAEELNGKRPGAAARCLNHLREKQGCGFGPNCHACAVRRAVVDSLETGTAHRLVEARLPVGGGDRPEELFLYVSTQPLRLQRHRRVVLVCLQDATDLHRAETRREALFAENTALLAATRAVLETDAISVSLRTVYDHCKKLVGGQVGFVAIRTPDNDNDLLFFDDGGFPCSVDPDLPMPIRGLVATAHERGVPVFDNDFARSHAASMPKGHLTLENVMFVPMLVGERVDGIIGLANKPGGFTTDDARRGTGFGEIAAVALRAERARRDLAHMEERILNNSGELVCVAGPDAILDYANPAWQRVLGFAAEELQGRPILDLVRTEDREKMRSALAAGETTTCESRWLHRDGSVRAVSWRLTPVPSEGRVYCVGRDVTEEKMAAHSSVQSDRLATMGLLAAGVAHEINNPLAYILFNLEVLCDELELAGSESTHVAKEALVGARRVRDITQGLRVFSRVESNGVVETDLHRTLEAAVNMAHNEIRHRATLQVDIPQLPVVHASEGRVCQVFVNLLVNAAHAIEEGRAAENKIGVRAWSEGDQVLVEVIDTGRGIAAADLPRLFEPFSSKAADAGSGLGLSVCKRILDDLGGSIRASSTPGQGSKFTVSLPVSKPAMDGGGSATEVTSILGRGRVLVVDDEEHVRDALCRLLEAEHEVESCISGAQARTLLARDRDFDLVLCDLMMPDVSGMQLHAWLRQEHPSIAERVVFVTGGAFTPGARDYLKQVDNLVVEKPFDRKQLAALVRSRLVTSSPDAGSDTTQPQ
jgi:PAS domain S-box-containing protein